MIHVGECEGCEHKIDCIGEECCEMQHQRAEKAEADMAEILKAIEEYILAVYMESSQAIMLDALKRVYDKHTHKTTWRL